MNDNERITYEEFMIMFKNAPRIAYTLYDKAEDEIERLNNVINELEKDAKENIRIGKNKGYQYVSNLKELLTAEEIYDYISYNCGLYIIEQLDKLKSLKEGK